MTLINHWIDGEYVSTVPSRTGPVFNPATGEETSQVAMASRDDVDLAVAAAKRAYETWRDTPLMRRQNIMFSFRDLVAKNRNELAAAMTAEHGKTIDDALGEVQRGLEVIEFACNIAHLLKGDFSEQVSTGVDTYSIRQSLGVVAGITPFNFPVMVPMWMFPIAIASGNTFVLKPSEKDPTVSQMVAELFSEAGLPDGVFNVVHGDKDAVDALLTHPDVAAISFVGSTPIARYIHETWTANGKRVQALGGAKNHMIVLPDADMDLAADAAVSAGFGSAGERCMAISVVISVGDAADRLLPKVQERIAKLKIAPGDTDGAEMGPLVTQQHLDKVTSYVSAGESEGATLLVDGRGIEVDDCENGFFIGPNLFDNVTTDMSIYTDEIFGPVLSVVRVESYEDAIQLINDNPYGNGTANQRPHPGTAGVLQLRGLEGLDLRLPRDLRTRGCPFLHTTQGRHQPLARSDPQRR